MKNPESAQLIKGSNIRLAVKEDAAKLRDLYQASIRGLVTGQYDAQQIVHWTNRPVEAFEQDIQNTTVGVCEFENQIIGYGQVNIQEATLGAVYVHRTMPANRLARSCSASSNAGPPQLTCPG
jgi:hypothetical protein